MTDKPRRTNKHIPAGPDYAPRHGRPREHLRAVPRNPRRLPTIRGAARRGTSHRAQQRRDAQPAQDAPTQRPEPAASAAVAASRPRVVLDAWPVLRRFDGEEPAASAIDELLKHPGAAIMSTVNHAEVCWGLIRDIGPQAARPHLAMLPQLIDLQAPSPQVAEAAARIKLGWADLSMADAIAAATAIAHGLELWTGDAGLLCADRAWKAHDLRDASRRHLHAQRLAAGKLKVGRRVGADNPLSDLDAAALAAYVIEPLSLSTPTHPPAAQLPTLGP